MRFLTRKEMGPKRRMSKKQKVIKKYTAMCQEELLSRDTDVKVIIRKSK